MGNQPDVASMGEADAPPALPRDERVQDYLDTLCAPLVGIVAYRERQSIRAEAEGHLYAQMEDFEAEGLPALEATEAALRAYGEPYRLGRAILDTWYRGKGAGIQPNRYSVWAVRRAFAVFGAASVLSLLLMQAYVFGWLGSGVCLFAAVLSVLSPLAAGALTGLLIPTRAGRAAVSALAILLPHSLAAALLLLPSREGLCLTLFQLFFWLPAGVGTAAFTEVMARYVRRTRFWHTAR